MIPKTDKETQPLLEVKNLKKYFPIKKGFLVSKVVGNIKAVDDVSFYIHEGETLGLVGESGCGKSTAGRTILRLLPPTAGTVLLEGQDMATAHEKEVTPEEGRHENTQGRGEGQYATAWKVVDAGKGRYHVYISEAHSYPVVSKAGGYGDKIQYCSSGFGTRCQGHCSR